MRNKPNSSEIFWFKLASYRFGSGVLTHGFVLNNNMDNYFNQVKDAQFDGNISKLLYNNRSTTFHSPMMVLDDEDEIKLVLSAYGDSRVITSMSLVRRNLDVQIFDLLISTLDFNESYFEKWHTKGSSWKISLSPRFFFRYINLRRTYHQGAFNNEDDLNYFEHIFKLQYELENLVKYGHAVKMLNEATFKWPWILALAYEDEDPSTFGDPRRESGPYWENFTLMAQAYYKYTFI